MIAEIAIAFVLLIAAGTLVLLIWMKKLPEPMVILVAGSIGWAIKSL